MQSRVHQSQQQPASEPLLQFVSSAVRARWYAVSAKLPRCCTSPSCMRHAPCPLTGLCSAARCACHHRAHQPHETTNRPLTGLCSAARCACHHRAHQPHETTNRARTYARALSTHLFSGCAPEHIQATTQKQAVQNFRNLPRLG